MLLLTHCPHTHYHPHTIHTHTGRLLVKVIDLHVQRHFDSIEQASDYINLESLLLQKNGGEDETTAILNGLSCASLLRLIHYFPRNGKQEKQEEVFEDHTDFGLLTIVPVSRVPGLQLWKQDTQEWMAVEEIYRQDETEGVKLVVFCGDTLQHATNCYFKAARHRVLLDASSSSSSTEDAERMEGEKHLLPETEAQGRRISCPFFLRALTNATIHQLNDRSLYCSVAEYEREYDSRPMHGN